LKAKPAKGHDQREHNKPARSAALEFFGNRSKLKFAGQAIEQADAKKREGRRHAAEEKVFQGRLARCHAGLVKGRQDIERDAEQFQRDENHQEVFRTDQDHQTRGGYEQERKILANVP
jgi:hypothetical protein